MTGDLIQTMAAHAARVEKMFEPEPSGPNEPVWTSYSALARHRTCPQRWNYAHLRKLEKANAGDVPVERDFGSWAHMMRAADSLARGRKHESLMWVPEELQSVDSGPTLSTEGVVPADVLHVAREWWDRQSSYVKDAWVERLGEGLVPRLLYVFDTWHEMWADQIKDERPLAVELKWTRALPMPAGSRPVMLIGYVDEVYKDLRRNLVVTRDHKFGKKLSTMTSADDMLESQLQLYAWGASPLVTAWGVGSIQATAYDRARMVKPSTPVLTASGGLSKSTGTDTDARTYAEWAQGPDGEGVAWGEPDTYFASGKKKGEPKFGFYVEDPSVTEGFSTPAERSKWFQRTVVPLNRNIVKAHLVAAVESAVDMQRTVTRVNSSGAAGRNLAKANCQWCDFAKLCRSEMFGGVDGVYDLADMGLRQR